MKRDVIWLFGLIILLAVFMFFVGRASAGQVIGEPNSNGWSIYEVPIHVVETGRSFTRYEYWLYREVKGGTLSVGAACQLDATYGGVYNPDGWDLDGRCVYGRSISSLDISFDEFANEFPEVIRLAHRWSKWVKANCEFFDEVLVFVMYGRYIKNQIYLLSVSGNNTRENAEIWYRMMDGGCGCGG